MSDRGDRRAEGYDPPQVEDVPAEDGPAITAAGTTGSDGGGPGPEWRGNEEGSKS